MSLIPITHSFQILLRHFIFCTFVFLVFSSLEGISLWGNASLVHVFPFRAMTRKNRDIWIQGSLELFARLLAFVVVVVFRVGCFVCLNTLDSAFQNGRKRTRITGILKLEHHINPIIQRLRHSANLDKYTPVRSRSDPSATRHNVKRRDGLAAWRDSLRRRVFLIHIDSILDNLDNAGGFGNRAPACGHLGVSDDGNLGLDRRLKFFFGWYVLGSILH